MARKTRGKHPSRPTEASLCALPACLARELPRRTHQGRHVPSRGEPPGEILRDQRAFYRYGACGGRTVQERDVEDFGRRGESAECYHELCGVWDGEGCEAEVVDG